jgi:SAM-dependent methyltransferase
MEIPVFILDDVQQTLGVAERALRPDEVRRALALDDGSTPSPESIHPFVRDRMARTGGYLYETIRHHIAGYPIPVMRLPEGDGKSLLDIGCNWGRWIIAAARRGYRITGIDPNFEALVVARQVCRQFGVDAAFFCADARYLPFADCSFDIVFSYSVIQHFSKEDACRALREIGRVLAGTSLVQMPNKFGVRSLYNQARYKMRNPAQFDVRYWSPRELFSANIGPSRLSIDGFFGLGIGAANIDDLSPLYSLVTRTSEALRSHTWLLPCADSLYVHSHAARFHS